SPIRGYRGIGRQPSYPDAPSSHQRQSEEAGECSTLPLETLARSWSADESPCCAPIALLHREIQANSRALFGRYWQDRDHRDDLLGSEYAARWTSSGLLRVGCRVASSAGWQCANLGPVPVHLQRLSPIRKEQS
uniref:Uncharacterized protein n=1 Tax=Meloidogyne javanica TaxID=6303 RepID=A0A915LQI6_MELJA